MLRPELRQIFEVYKEVKKPLQTYSSSKSLKKSSSKGNLKRQSSSPYIQVVDTNHTSFNKISRSKSPKRKNKSMESRKLKDNSFGKVGIRSKFGASFESVKKSTGDIFSQMHPSYKKDKENTK